MNITLLSICLLLLIIPVSGVEPRAVIGISPDIELIQLDEQFFIHRSFVNSQLYGRFSSNGLILIKNGKALIIDTPMTDEETAILGNYLLDSMKVKMVTFIGGHYHDDCIGGMEYLKTNGVHTILSQATRQLCIKNQLPLPDQTFDQVLDFDFEGVAVECRYFGGGHTSDNIVVYFPAYKLLFGGCLIKSANSQNLGNIADAVVGEWAQTVTKISAAFPETEMVIPGHGDFGGKELLEHTVLLVKKHLKNE